jgi:hypothetical protein
MGLETAGLIMAGSALAGTGAGIYTGIKQAEEQKKYSKKQKSLQQQKETKLQEERKKKIDLMRSQLLAPSLFGGRRSLQTGGEMGLTREVLG